MTAVSHLEFYWSNNGFFEKPMYRSYNRDHSSKLISFLRKSRFCVCILATERRTNGQADGQHQYVKPLARLISHIAYNAKSKSLQSSKKHNRAGC